MNAMSIVSTIFVGLCILYLVGLGVFVLFKKYKMNKKNKKNTKKENERKEEDD